METLKEKLGHIIVPMVTPFDKNPGEVNLKEAAKLADFLIEKKYLEKQ